ncbi:Uncharacterized protein EbC_32080 [Erwinia billingiae Eb661]|uniref:Uncharacterized protein n=1 Tax=Erwinia billingiae (strain Eb661) TaxID=634500 RepID=D8MV82_ERWBE|nr:Uncharacterized protein EbC_32080 [Erwinia billingiae Eb661]
MIVDRKDGKWRVTQMACGCHWRADLTEGKGVFAGKVISQQMNKDQFERWKDERKSSEPVVE